MIALKKELESKIKREYSLALIEGLIEEEEKDFFDKKYWEACHAVIVEKNKSNIYYDVNGKNIFVENDNSFIFSNIPEKVRIKIVENEEEYKYTFGNFSEEMEEQAKKYILWNKYIEKTIISKNGAKNEKRRN